MSQFFLDLNTNAGAVTAIFTAIYVFGTFLMWWEMRKSRLRLDEPNIQISLEPQLRWGNFLDLLVENIGNIPVYDLKLTIYPSGLKTRGDKNLEDLNLFKKTIPVFGVGQKIKTFAISYIDFVNKDQSRKIRFVAEYRTGNNKKRIVQEYDFDLEVYLGMTALSEKSLNDVVEQLKELTKETTKIASSIQDNKEV
jgi:hypothetical protein